VHKPNQRYYDEFANWYENGRDDGYHALIDDLEAELACRYGAGGRVLEAGCGTGLILRRVAPVAATAHGIDLSRGMLERAAPKRLSVAQASVAALPFADDTFDLVYSFKVLAHVEPIVRALGELARVVRPGGRLLLEFYNRNSLRYLIKRLRPPLAISTRTRDDEVYTRFDTLGTIRRALPAGIEIERVRGIRVGVTLPHALRLPVVGGWLGAFERWAADARGFRETGGFLIVVARKAG
jgi:ubiquinone/menaquinone biosynthesis C-methylase UbiE